MQDAPIDADRTRRRPQPGADLPALLLQGGALRPDRHALPLELPGELEEAADCDEDPVARLEAVTGAFADFCLRYPAFLDCALSLMRRPAAELQERVSDAVWIRLGQGMGSCLGICADVLADGRDAGRFTIVDPDFTANHLWTAALGAMHLARIGVGVSRAAPGLPAAFPVDAETVRGAVVRAAVAIATS